MPNNRFLLYGANGYTGRLIIGYAAQYGLEPILAGRTQASIRPLAEQHNLPYRIVDLQDQPRLIQILQEVPVVLHVAGPFSQTAKPMIAACLQAKAHYLDITGEIPVFEMAKKYDAGARQAGIMVMPGVGFDVVPTDCLAVYLKQQLPDAIQLRLAFTSLGGSLSHGTATTMAASLGEGSCVRQHGAIIRKPLGHKSMWCDFGVKKIFVMTIPWGDISTAFHSTQIPDIETYAGIKPWIWRLLTLQPAFNWLLRTKAVRQFVRRQINKRPAGPSDAQRLNSKSLVWGEVSNASGKRVTARMVMPDGYTLTALASLNITQKVLHGNFTAGYQTPASAYGAGLILEIPGTSRELIKA